LEQLVDELSEYLSSYREPVRIDGLVGLAKRGKESFIWISTELLDVCSEKEIDDIITKVTGWKFPDEWGFSYDSRGAYKYHTISDKD